MKKLFDKRVFFDTLKQLVNLVILVLIIGILIDLASVNIISQDSYGFAATSIGYNTITNLGLFIAMIIGSPILAIASLKFTWNKKQADFVYSLPITKDKLYISKALAVIGAQFAVLLIIAITEIFLSLEILGKFIFLDDILFGLINTFIGSLIIIGALFLASSVTGKFLSFAILSIGIIAAPFLVPIISYSSIVRSVANLEAVVLFKPSLYVLTNIFLTVKWYANFLRYIPGIIISAILAVSYLTGGYFLFKKRSGEVTGVYSKNKLVHFIVMSIVPFVILCIEAISLMDHGLFYEKIKSKYISEIVICLTAALFTLFAYDVFVYRKIRRKNRCIWVFLVLGVLALGINYTINKTTKNELMLKIDPEKVESVNLIANGEVVTLYSDSDEIFYGNYISSYTDITEKEIIEELAYCNNENMDEAYKNKNYLFNYSFIVVKFNFKSGRSVYKNVPLYDDPEKLDETFTKIFTSTDCAESIYENIPIKYFNYIIYGNQRETLDKNAEFLEEVYEVFCEEYKDLSIEQKRAIKWWMSGDYDYNINYYGDIYVVGRVKGTNVIDNYYITKYTPKTVGAYMNAMNKINLSDFEKILTDFYEISSFNQYRVYFNNHYTVLNKNEENQSEYFIQIIELIKDEGYSTPFSYENAIKIKYVDSGQECEVFLGVTEETMNELEKIYIELQEKSEK